MSKVNEQMDMNQYPEGYLEHLQENKKFIEELAREEIVGNRDSISTIKNRIKLERTQTDIQKERFINEIKSGLGDVVKEKPNEITIIKKPWHHKFSSVIKRILSKI